MECAVEDIPMIVCYKLSAISWWMANNITSVKYASIVNLIADENIVPEFLQHNMTEENLVKSIIPLLNAKSIERKKKFQLYCFNDEQFLIGQVSSTVTILSHTVWTIILSVTKKKLSVKTLAVLVGNFAPCGPRDCLLI